VEITGRVGSLLEVGTGFHPELTGRENIFLNGAILGMTRKEIARKFDDIVAFSGVEKFVDTPVKHYSSGMHVRLGFAVAAHLDPEILIVDEILAVGDAEFQRRCLGKMEDIAKGGRTVFLVSHNLATVQSLCTSAIVLDAGEVVGRGDVAESVKFYLDQITASTSYVDLRGVPREHGLKPVFTRLEFLDETGRETSSIQTGSAVTIRLHYEHSERILCPYFGLTIETQLGVRVLWFQTRLQEKDFPTEIPRVGCITCFIPSLPLTPGSYVVMLGCGSGQQQLDLLPRVAKLEITERDVFGTGRLPESTQALVLLTASWNMVREPTECAERTPLPHDKP
jgi:lipopolysaccharide transport system ATP-binding protein